MTGALYLAIKLLHIVLAITAVGANFTYGVWFARANRNPEFAPFALRGITFIDDYIANPAYVLLLPSGAAMVALGGFGFGTLWVAAAMTLLVVALGLGYLGYTPTLRAQLAAVERGGIDDPEADRLAGRARIIVILLGIIVFAILVLMVFKPH